MDDTNADPALDFANSAIDVRDLPQLHDHPFAPLDPAYVRLRASIALTVAAVVLAATAGVASATSSWIPVFAGTAGLALVAAVAIAQRIEADHMGYLIREHDVSLRSGVISRSVATAPFARVQHVSIASGPVERRFGLSTLQLRTAGGQIAVPGLPHAVAERLKELVAERAATSAEAEAARSGDAPAW